MFQSADHRVLTIFHCVLHARTVPSSSNTERLNDTLTHNTLTGGIIEFGRNDVRDVRWLSEVCVFAHPQLTSNFYLRDENDITYDSGFGFRDVSISDCCSRLLVTSQITLHF